MKKAFYALYLLTLLYLCPQETFGTTIPILRKETSTDGNIYIIIDIQKLDKAEVIQAILLAARPDAYSYRPYGHPDGRDTLVIDAVEDVYVPETLKEMRDFLEDCIYDINEKEHIALIDGCNLGRTLNVHIPLDESTLHVLYPSPARDPFYTETWVEEIVGCLHDTYQEQPLTHSYSQPSWLKEWLSLFLPSDGEHSFTQITGPLNTGASHAKQCSLSWMTPKRKHYLNACEKAIERMGNTLREFWTGRTIKSEQLLQILHWEGSTEHPELLLHSYIFEQPVQQPTFIDKEASDNEPSRIVRY